MGSGARVQSSDQDNSTIVVEAKEGLGKKHDTGKSPIFQGVFQYFPRAVSAVGLVSKYGADKYQLEYDDINWFRVEDGFNRYSDALSRHLLGEFIDGPIDPESKQYHAAMVAWNALARLELILSNKNE